MEKHHMSVDRMPGPRVFGQYTQSGPPIDHANSGIIDAAEGIRVMTEPDTTTSSEHDRLPKHTTPTWEVELLISGVAVFAMLQLPGWLDDRMLMLRPRFDADWSELLLLMGFYLKGATIILAVTFALHLLLRAQWIALVGMHSVFPDGIRWERLRMGPVQRGVERGRYISRAASIDRADNRATVVFAIGVMLATALLLLCLFAGLLTVLGVVVARASGHSVRSSWVLLALLALSMGPLLLANILDRRAPALLPEGGRLRRWIAALFRFYSRVGVGRGSEVMALLSSHGGAVRMGILVFTVFVVALFGGAFGMYVLREPGSIGNYALFPQMTGESGRLLQPAHYDDQRNPLRDSVAAFVQSQVVPGPYLDLVVPFEPKRDVAALRSNCAAALDMADGDARALAILHCLAQLHPVTLDGKPLPGLRYDTGTDSRTDRPALQAMIDMRAVAPGRHELRVGRAPPPADRDDDDYHAAADKAWVIPFWR
jgi:hypothetical protein